MVPDIELLSSFIERTAAEGVPVDWKILKAMEKWDAEFSNNHHLTFSSTLIIYMLNCKYFVVYK